MSAAALWAIGMAQAMPTPAVPLVQAFERATAFCAVASDTPERDIPGDATLYVADAEMPGLTPRTLEAMRKTRPELAAKVDSMSVAQPFSALPALIQRVMATSTSRHLADPSGALRFAATSGEAWAMFYRGSTCEVVVTGSATPVDAIVRNWADRLPSNGWSVVRSVDQSASAAMSERLLVKRSPRADAPLHATRIRMKWMKPADRQGVQAEINYLSGDIAQPAPAAKP
jgi:hypothetical protein